MPLLSSYEYDIFISYRQNDNKYDGWVTEFVDNLQKELDATLKNSVSIYFDENPHDGLLDTHVVDESLAKKLKCLIFIPIISQTYCDENSFAWRHEFLAFNELAKSDELGINITLANGNVASRILPIRIHDIDPADQQKFEGAINGPMRAIDFIYSETGVNRSLKPADDKKENLNNTSYRNQMNKVAHSMKDLGAGLQSQTKGEDLKPDASVSKSLQLERPTASKKTLITGVLTIIILALVYLVYFNYSNQEISTVEIAEQNKSIAVLPFTNMSSDSDQDYFCDGLAEDIRYDLSQLAGLDVKARTSSFAFKDKNLSVAELGARLGVSTLLEGSVQKSGNQLRITAQLVNVSDGSSIWSKRYDKELEDVFAIKDEIAQSIVEALSIKLSSNELKKLDKLNTSDAKAYDYYIRGREYFHGYHDDKILLSIPLFEKAISIDSNYALAYSGLADSYSQKFNYFDNSRINLEQALLASQKALELDPDLAEAHSSRGMALFQNDQFEEAEKEFKKAITLDPKLFDAYYEYGRASRAKGMHLKASRQFKKAAEIEPDNYHPIAFLVVAYEDLGMTAELSDANKVALKVFENHIELYPEDARALYLGTGPLIRSGQPEKALEWLKKAISLNPNEISVLYNAACTYSKLGRKDEALNYLDRAIEAGYGSRDWINTDSDLDNIRDDPRFQPIIDKIN